MITTLWAFKERKQKKIKKGTFLRKKTPRLILLGSELNTLRVEREIFNNHAETTAVFVHY